MFCVFCDFLRHDLRASVAALKRDQAADRQRIETLERKVMSQQDDINNAIAEFGKVKDAIPAVETAIAALKAEIVTLQQQNPALDTSGLVTAAADADAALSGLTAAVAPPAPPAPPASS